MIEPDEAIDIIHARFGSHPRTRALHAKGTWLEGTFTATPESAAISRAAHLQGTPVPVLARVSNAEGNPRVPDYAPDVRGLAVSFKLPDGSATDMVAQNAPRFFNPTSDDFLNFIKANTGKTSPLKLAAYLAAHPKAVAGLPANAAALRPVASYVQSKYFGVHAYRWVDAEGKVSNIRWIWVPEAGEAHLGPAEARKRGRDYLGEEIADRLSKGPARFTLEVTVAAPGDSTEDPSKHWPKGRETFVAGTLELTTVIDDPETDGNIVVFDPTRMTDGIELSDDKILAYRARAYSASANLRSS
ncbi:MAG: catalase family peroxidase [Aeromicrobium sp.]